MSGEPRTGRPGGFTLIEVLAALVILSLSLGALLQLFSTGLRGVDAAEGYTTATLIAESRLAGVGVERPLREGEETGTFDDRFRWRVVVRPLAIDPGGDPADGPVRAFEVVVAVLWDEAGGERSVSLTTLRLAPNP